MVEWYHDNNIYKRMFVASWPFSWPHSLDSRHRKRCGQDKEHKQDKSKRHAARATRVHRVVCKGCLEQTSSNSLMSLVNTSSCGTPGTHRPAASMRIPNSRMFDPGPLSEVNDKLRQAEADQSLPKQLLSNSRSRLALVLVEARR